ncbi:MAG: hypothetical protein PHC66_03790 [Candidatus Nanoarchaeia archaeon]|nr:hypothetical protein [Candidatus Nanoarchaeia archaeon]MDD5239217.1 hypothetical protein [Candidatus Nanoarchaeia archaeon]
MNADKILTAVIIATVMYLILNIFLNQQFSAGIAAAGAVLMTMLCRDLRKKH